MRWISLKSSGHSIQMKNTPSSQMPIEHSPGQTTSWVTNQTSVNLRKLKLYQASFLTTTLRDSVQFSSVSQSCATLCDPMNCSIQGLPVPHHLPKFALIQVYIILCSKNVLVSACIAFMLVSKILDEFRNSFQASLRPSLVKDYDQHAQSFLYPHLLTDSPA